MAKESVHPRASSSSPRAVFANRMFRQRREVAAFSVRLRHACSCALADDCQELKVKRGNREGALELYYRSAEQRMIARADLVSSGGAKKLSSPLGIAKAAASDSSRSSWRRQCRRASLVSETPPPIQLLRRRTNL